MYHMAMQPQYGCAHAPVHSILPNPFHQTEGSHSLSHYNQSFPSQTHEIDFPSPQQSLSLNQNFNSTQSLTSHYPTHTSTSLNSYGRTQPNGSVSMMTVTNQLGMAPQTRNTYSTNINCQVYPTNNSLSRDPNNAQFGVARQLTVDEELLEEMGTLHLGYLETEDSPHKFEQREKLETVIMEFLAITAHSRKFAFRHVREVLERSILTQTDFNAHGAACAFDALSQYAANLLSQPWRKEFRQIKLYSGFWRHQVANHLLGAESILELMGYTRQVSKSKSMVDASRSSSRAANYTYELLGVIDPDLMARLALDCLIAYCECQSLKKIKEGTKEYGLSWAQILQFRQIYIGGIDVSVRHFLFTLRQRSSQNSPSKTPKTLRSPDTGIDPSAPPLPVRHILSSGYSSGDPVIPGVDSEANEARSHGTGRRNRGAAPTSVDEVDGVFGGSVPTAKLIDLDSSFEGSSHHHSNQHSMLPKVLPQPSRSSSLQKSNRNSLPRENNHNFCMEEHIQPPPEAFKEGTLDDHLEATLDLVKSSKGISLGPKKMNIDNLENWDFVFKGLEKKGYNKDIGDRGDILLDGTDGRRSADKSSKSNHSVNNSYREGKTKNVTINQALHQLSLMETKERMDKPLPSMKGSRSIGHSYSNENRQNRNSFYDNLSGSVFETAPQGSEDSEDKRPPVSIFKKMNHALRGASDNSRSETVTANKTLESGSSSTKTEGTQRMKDILSKSSKESLSKSWSCVTCTFENKYDVKICEMCGKSKEPGPEAKPLESGGRQCPLCTLVNDKNMDNCSACGVDLKGSYTYI